MSGVIVALIFAVALASGAILAGRWTAQQDEHRRAGRFGPADPAGTGVAVEVMAAVPIRRVRTDSIEFDDGSGVLLERPDRPAMARLAVLAGATAVVLEDAHGGPGSLRLAFRAADELIVLAARSWRAVAPPASRVRSLAAV